MDNEIDYVSMRASTGQRFATVLLDVIFVYILAFVIGMVLALAGLQEIVSDTNNYVFGIILMLIYYVPQEATSGRTIGKRIVGTRAISLDGGRITALQCAGRTLCRVIPFEAFSFLGGGGHPWGWHDKFSNTQVVVLQKLAASAESTPSA